MDPKDLEKIVRETNPRWVEDGYGLKGPPRSTPLPTGSSPATVSHDAGRWPLKTEMKETPFPADAQDITQTSESPAAAAADKEYAFELELDEIDNDTSHVIVLVVDGEVNGTLVPGMTGADDYFLTLDTPGTEIWVAIPYDTDTLAIDPTAVYIDYGPSVPDSTAGFLYVPIGYVDWDYDTDGNIISVVPHNRHCGDILVALIYGSINGVASYIPISVLGDWIAV